MSLSCVPKISKLRSGGKDLTASGAYPFQFGHRVARLHTKFMDTKHAYRETSDLKALFKAGFQDRIYAGEAKFVPYIENRWFNNQTFHCGLPQTLSDSHTGLVSQASIRLPCRILAMLGSLRNLDLWRVFWWQPPMLESSSQTLWFRLILNPGKKFIEIL